MKHDFNMASLQSPGSRSQSEAHDRRTSEPQIIGAVISDYLAHGQDNFARAYRAHLNEKGGSK